MRSSADGRSAVLLAERQRDEAIEFKPVRAAAHSVLMVSESRQRNREKSSHSKHHLFWLQGLAYPHWSLGGIQPPTPPSPPPTKKSPVVCSGGADILSIPLFAFPSPSLLKEREHSSFNLA